MSNPYQNDPFYKRIEAAHVNWSLLVTYRRSCQYTKAYNAGEFNNRAGYVRLTKAHAWCEQRGFTRDQLMWNQERWHVHLYKLYIRERARDQRKAGQAR